MCRNISFHRRDIRKLLRVFSVMIVLGVTAVQSQEKAPLRDAWVGREIYYKENTVGEQKGVVGPIKYKVFFPAEVIDAKDDRVLLAGNVWIDTADTMTYDEAFEYYDEQVRNRPESSEMLRYRGQCLLKVKKYEDAIIDFTEAIRVGPQDHNAYFYRGIAEGEYGKYDVAVEDFEEAIRLEPRFHNARVHLGITYYRSHQYEKAVKILTIAIDSLANAGQGLNFRGLAYRELGNLHDASSDFRRAIEHDPHNMTYRLNRVFILLSLKDVDTAVIAAEEAMTHNPRHPLCYVMRARTFENRKLFDDARRDLDRALELDPGCITAHIARSEICLTLLDYDQAIQNAKQALALQPKLPHAHYLYGISLSKKNLFKEAIKEYDRAIEFAPHSSSAYIGRAEAKLALKDSEGADRDGLEALRIAPKDEEALRSRGKYFMAVKNYREARSQFAKLYSQNSQNDYACVRRADAYRLAFDYQSSMFWLKKAIAINPQSSVAYTSRGLTNAASGDFTAAVKDYEAALRLEPRDPEALCGLGLAKLELGRRDDGLKDVESALKLDPKFPPAHLARARFKLTEGDPQGALGDLRQAAELELNPIRAYTHIAAILAFHSDPSVKNLPLAREYAAKTKIPDLSPLNHWATAFVSAAEGNFEDAVSHGTKARQSNVVANSMQIQGLKDCLEAWKRKENVPYEKIWLP